MTPIQAAVPASCLSAGLRHGRASIPFGGKFSRYEVLREFFSGLLRINKRHSLEAKKRSLDFFPMFFLASIYASSSCISINIFLRGPSLYIRWWCGMWRHVLSSFLWWWVRSSAHLKINEIAAKILIFLFWVWKWVNMENYFTVQFPPNHRLSAGIPLVSVKFMLYLLYSSQVFSLFSSSS